MEHTRNMQEWMRAVERKLANNNRSIGHVGRTVITDIREELVSSDTRQPTFPIEVTYQTALYIAPQSRQQRARLMVDFPDVTKATDGTDIEIASYELWGRDDTMNALEATTSAVPGVLAPGITFPGLAATQANKDISAKNQGPWKLLASSTASSLRAEGLIPGSVWSFKVRALGTLQKKPGLFSAEFQTQLDKDTEPPSQPTKPELTSSMGTIMIRWDGLSVNGAMPSDFEYVNVAHGTTASPTAVVTRFYRGGGIHVLSGFEYYQPQFVRFQAVDLSGNESAWSEQAVEFTTPLVDTDIILSELDAAKTVLKNVGAESIKDGAILDSKLADNAVTQKKLADGAITLAKLDTVVVDRMDQGARDALTANTTAMEADAKAGEAQVAADFALAEAAKANLLINGDFESDVFNLAHRVESVESRSGTHCAAIPATGWNTIYWNIIPVIPGQKLEIRFWAKSSGDIGNVYPQVAFDRYGPSGVDLGLDLYPTAGEFTSGPATTAYTEYVFPMPVIPDGTHFVRLRTTVSGTVYGTGTTYLDDVWLGDISAMTAAKAAQQRADDAFQQAGDAFEQAGLAQDSANGKNSVYYLPALPSGTGFADGDTVFIRSAVGQPITGQHRWNKTGETTGNWESQSFGHQIFASVDLGKATVGELDGIYIKARTLNASHIVVSDTTNIYPDPYFKLGTSRLTGGNVWEYGASLNSGKGAIRYVNTSTGTVYGPMLPDNIPVTEGSLYHFSVDAAVTGGTTPNFNIRVYFYDKDGNLSNQGVPLTINADKSVSYAGLNGTYRTLSGILAVPAGRVSMQLRPTFYTPTGTGETFYLSNYRISRAANADLIVDGTITGDKVEAQSVAAKVGAFIELDVSQLNAGAAQMDQATIDKLWAEVVNAKKITADMMVISNGTNAFPDPHIRDADGWASAYFNATGGRSGGGTIVIPQNSSQSGTYYAQGANLSPRRTPLIAGATYRLSGWAKTSGSAIPGSIQLYLRYYSVGGTASGIATNVSTDIPYNKVATVAGQWMFISGKVKIPDDTTYLEGALGVFKQTTYTTGTTTWSDLGIQLATSGQLIVDGDITSNHLATDSVTAAAIKALAIQAGHIAANAVEADKIKAGAVTAVKLEAELALVTKIIAGPVTGTHAEMNASGFKVFAEDPETGIPYETVRMGVADTSDLLSITNSVGESVINLDSLGTIAGKSVEAENTLYYKGEELSSYVGSRPRGMAAWAQVEIKTNMAVSNGTVGLFELAWDGGDIPGRMYEFNVNTFIVNASAAGTVGMRLFFTTDGSAPTINSPTMQYNYIRTSAAGFVSLGGSRIVGSNNGNYIRVLVALYASSGVVATVTLDPNQTHLLATVMDLGESMPPTGVASTGGGTPYSGSTVAPPTIAKVTKTLEYGYTSVKSYLPNNTQYQYNIGKAYQGLSPAGYGNLRSIYSFNQDFVGLLNGATIEGVWIYIYFEHWYYNAGGSAIIRLHNQSGAPSTYTGVTGNGFSSSGWPKAAGRWVSVPSNLWAGFASGAYKGFALIGDSSYGTYGIANNARLKFKFTK